MKKLFIAIAVVGLGAFATSCKKDYTCACTVDGESLDVPIQDAKKGDAEDACDAAEATYKMGDPGASCELK